MMRVDNIQKCPPLKLAQGLTWVVGAIFIRVVVENSNLTTPTSPKPFPEMTLSSQFPQVKYLPTGLCRYVVSENEAFTYCIPLQE